MKNEPLEVSAMEELAKELDLEYSVKMQDWTYEVSNFTDIEKYIRHYKKLNSSNKKYFLMEIIIQSIEEQTEAALHEKYWLEAKMFLISDAKLHEDTIFYWCLWDIEWSEDCWKITAKMRQLWKSLNPNDPFINKLSRA